MTDATPLASEQITQEDREAAEKLEEALGFLSREESRISEEHFARHRIAALSASPAPSGQGVSGEVVECSECKQPAPCHSTACVSRPDTSRLAFERHLAAPAPSCAPGEAEGALAAAKDFIMSQDNSTGCCMCGSPVDGHGYGDGHSPVDEGSYHAMQIVQQIDAALSSHKQEGGR